MLQVTDIGYMLKPEASQVRLRLKPFSECGGPEGMAPPEPSWRALPWADTWHHGGAPKLLFVENNQSQGTQPHTSAVFLMTISTLLSLQSFQGENHLKVQMQSHAAFHPAPSPRAALRPLPGLAPLALGKQHNPPDASLYPSPIVESNNSDSVE